MEDDTLYDKVTLPLTDAAPRGGDTPLLLAILLLVFFPPAAWFIMWKEEGFDHWLGYLTGFYGILAIIVSFITKLILLPQIHQFYLTNHLQEPSVSPLAYLNVYYLIGIIEIIIAIVLYVIHEKHKKLPKNWLIAGVIGLAISSLIPFTFVFLTYTAFNNLVEQSKQPVGAFYPTTPPTNIVSSPTTSQTANSASPFITKAKELLSQQKSVKEAEITVVTAQQKSWPDGSLGCPKPGMMYAQHVVDGYQVILKANNKQYDYHAANSVDSMFLCEK